MADLTFGGDIAELQRTLAGCHDLIARRTAVVDALQPRVGERILEIGCGGGAYAHEVARSVGESGRVEAIDASADQIAAARERCADQPWVACQVADAVDLPFPDESFDAVYAVQVLEYVSDVAKALAEIRRVLRPAGRLIVASTNWSALVWHSGDPDRMRRVLDAWSGHAPQRDLPAALAEHLSSAGLRRVRQTPLTVLNTSYDANSFGYWGARLIAAYVAGRGLLAADEVRAWLDDLDEVERRGMSFLSSTPILTEAVRTPSVHSGGTASDVAVAYIERLERRDWDGVSELLADDVVYEMPQTRERIRGRSAFLRFNEEYPGDWHLRIRRVLADGRHAALWLDVRIGDEPLDACVWIDVSEHGRIERITDYWPESYEPPGGREHLAERW